jgi:hypothetical protein
MPIPGLQSLGRLFFARRTPEVTGGPGRVTFAVSKVWRARRPLPEQRYHQAVADFLGGPVESCSNYRGRLVAGARSHPLIAALHAAYSSHRPVCLSPDIIWLTLTQGLAHHVNANAEQLRHHFVRHEGKLTIAVRRDDFVKGSPENPWPEVFSEFSAAIRGHIGEETHRLIVADFSTTGLVERAASEVVLLDAMHAFFSYEVHTICGIPSVTLEGTVEDWEAIAGRTEAFARFGLGWWVDALRPILGQFVAAAGGKVDLEFWESMYKWQGSRGCLSPGGSPHISGWVVNLFPYLVNPEARYAAWRGDDQAGPSLCRNPWIGAPPGHHGPGRDDIPALPARAPFRWVFPDREFEMEFVGGLIGIRQDAQTLCLRPEIGWAVRQAGTRTQVGHADYGSL